MSTCISICKYTYIYIDIYIYVHMYLHVHLCMYICVYLYIYIYTCMHMYAHARWGSKAMSSGHNLDIPSAPPSDPTVGESPRLPAAKAARARSAVGARVAVGSSRAQGLRRLPAQALLPQICLPKCRGLPKFQRSSQLGGWLYELGVLLVGALTGTALLF